MGFSETHQSCKSEAAYMQHIQGTVVLPPRSDRSSDLKETLVRGGRKTKKMERFQKSSGNV
jgi:hypothetical protein